MALLYYWRGDNYRRDLDYGAGYHLNQSNRIMHSIDIGDSLWAFTRNREGSYVIAAELVVRAKTLNPHNFRYGRYRLWGDLRHSRYFETGKQPSAESVLRSLSVRTDAELLGRAFQGHSAVRRISRQDHQLLAAHTQHLPLEPRARLLPEERLEATLLLGDPLAVQSLVMEEAPGIAEERRQYLYSQAPTRNRELVKEIQKLYDGSCQICLWKPVDLYGLRLCQAHHVHWLSRGGEDELSNLVLVCPNHHLAIHRCDAPFDYGTTAFQFPSREERLVVNRHVPR